MTDTDPRVTALATALHNTCRQDHKFGDPLHIDEATRAIAALPEGAWPPPDLVRATAERSRFRQWHGDGDECIGPTCGNPEHGYATDADNAALRAALGHYGRHIDLNCYVDANVGCMCGLEAVLANTTQAAEDYRREIEKPWREALQYVIDINDAGPDMPIDLSAARALLAMGTQG